MELGEVNVHDTLCYPNVTKEAKEDDTVLIASGEINASSNAYSIYVLIL